MSEASRLGRPALSEFAQAYMVLESRTGEFAFYDVGRSEWTTISAQGRIEHQGQPEWAESDETHILTGGDVPAEMPLCVSPGAMAVWTGISTDGRRYWTTATSSGVVNLSIDDEQSGSIGFTSADAIELGVQLGAAAAAASGENFIGGPYKQYRIVADIDGPVGVVESAWCHGADAVARFRKRWAEEAHCTTPVKARTLTSLNDIGPLTETVH